MPAADGLPGSGRSQHPDDVLIRELIRTGREATAEEVERVAARIATAPFDSAVRKVPVKDRGLSYQAIVLGDRATSLDYHLVKRVVVEQQWADGTNAEGYVADLRRAASLPQARVVVYLRHAENHAVAMVNTRDVLSQGQLGPRPDPLMVVIHSADRGIMVTGYQVSGIETLNIPEDARWLR